MSNFWTTSDGEDIRKDTKTEYDIGGGDFEPIPAKTWALASIVGAAWKTDNDGNKYINIHWSIVKHEGYANRRIFQKLWVSDDDPKAKDPAKKRDKARKLLATIDANAGGKLAKAGREPDDDDLALALTNKQMMVLIMTWDKEDAVTGKTEIGGNWISAVAPKGSHDVTVPPKSSKPAKLSDDAFDNDDMDDDFGGDSIPF